MIVRRWHELSIAAVLCAVVLFSFYIDVDPKLPAVEKLTGKDLDVTAEEFWKAVDFDHVNDVKLFLDAGMDVNTRQKPGGNTVLHQAAISHKEEVANLLLDAGADIHAIGEQGQTVLGIAVQNQNKLLVKRLIKMGADINGRHHNQSAPLFGAIAWGREDTARILLDAGASVRLADDRGNSLLMVAVRENRPAMVMMLLGYDVDVDFIGGKDRTIDRTALIMAVERHQDRMVKLLLEHQANVNTPGPSGKTALIWAVEQNLYHIALELIDAGADVNAKDKYGRSVLLHAINNRHHEMAEMLLAHGASVNTIDKQGNTLLSQVIRQHKYSFLDMLLAAGANVTQSDNEKYNVLKMAIEQGQSDVVKRLIAAGADKFNVDKRARHTALMIATINGQQNADVVQLLLKIGAKLEAVDFRGWTALSMCAAYGSQQAMRALIQAGANIHHRLPNGETPLMIATKKGHVELVRELISAGAELLAKESQEYTALNIAEQYGHMSIASMLRKSMGLQDDERYRNLIKAKLTPPGEMKFLQ